MSKKELTAEERIKKYGNKIVGGGIFYLILKPIVMFLQTGTLFLNTVSLIINLVLMVLVILMTVGVAKKKKLGIVAGWVFEALLLVILVFEAFLLMTFGFGLFGMTGFNLIDLIITIWLPIELSGLSKALKNS